MPSRLNEKLRISNEDGVVSIITVVLLAMVLTLITTAFVKSTNSNRRQALDNQLSTQAFYAAETGINDATTLIKKGIGVGAVGAADCATFMGIIDANRADIGRDFGTNGPSVLNSGNNTEYTCVIVSSEVPNISVTAEKGQGYVYPIKSASGGVIDRLNIKWGQGQSTTTSLGSQLPSQTVWGNDDRKALIRLTLYYPTALNRPNLVASQKTFFLRPVTSGGSNSLVATSADGALTMVTCSDSNECNVDITNINGMTGIIDPASNRTFYIRVEPIYNAASITLEAYSGVGQQNLTGAQYSIDVTGRANDVYRRIEVRRKIETNWPFPNATVQAAGDLCKQFEIWPGGYNDAQGCLSP